MGKIKGLVTCTAADGTTKISGCKEIEKHCIFPFKFNGVSYNTCANSPDDPRAWCSTEVDEVGVHITGKGEWFYCDMSTNQPSQSSQTSLLWLWLLIFFLVVFLLTAICFWARLLFLKKKKASAASADLGDPEVGNDASSEFIGASDVQTDEEGSL